MPVVPYALVDGSGVVVNVCLWDGSNSWTPPAGLEAVRDEDGLARIGGTWDGEAFQDPMPEPEVEA